MVSARLEPIAIPLYIDFYRDIFVEPNKFYILQVLKSKVVVHSMRITEKAESKVGRLADLTGGSKTYSDGTSPAPIIDAFRLLIDNAIDGKSISSYRKKPC